MKIYLSKGIRLGGQEKNLILWQNVYPFSEGPCNKIGHYYPVDDEVAESLHKGT